MSVTAKVLADGQLPASQTAIYTAAVTTYVTFMTFFNTHATAQTIELWLNASGTARQILYVDDLGQNERVESTARVVLESGDILLARTTTASAVDFVLTGGQGAS